MIPLRIHIACILCFFAASIQAAIDSGGGMAYVGNLQAHASVGSPFSTSAVTAGAVDILYPLESRPGTTPDTTTPSAPIAPASGVTSQAPQKSSAKKPKKISPKKSPAKTTKKNSPKKTAKKSNKK
jgi:hypothetical protein